MTAVRPEVRIEHESPAVVRDGKADPCRLIRENHTNRPRGGVFHDVRDCFLRHAEYRGFDIRSCGPDRALNGKFEAHVCAAHTFLCCGPQRRYEVAAGQRRRPYVPDGTTRILERRLGQRNHVAQGGNDRWWTLYAVGDRDEVQPDPGESLEQRVVQLAGDPRALVEHRRESRLRGVLARTPQPPRCSLARGHVHHDADVFDRLAGFVEQRPAQAPYVADGAVGSHDAYVELVTALLAEGGSDALRGKLAVIPVPDLTELRRMERRSIGIESQDADAFLRPDNLPRGEIPGPAPGVAQALRGEQVFLVAAKLRGAGEHAHFQLGPRALEPLGRRPSCGTEPRRQPGE